MNSIKSGIISAEIIERWSNDYQRKFQSLFSEIIKKIIIETIGDDAKNLIIPSGNDIWQPGFDGKLINIGKSTEFIPTGKILIEIGSVIKNPWKKIKEDFKKRNELISEKEKKETTFILFSSQKLAQIKKEKFCKENKNTWQNLRIYDASDLANWLAQCPFSTVYFYEKIENRKLNYHSLEKAWINFKKRTDPELTTSFFTAGRITEIEKLTEYIENEKLNQITIKASSFEEAYGFTLSVLFDKYNNKKPIIVIDNKETLEQITEMKENQIFITNFDIEEISLSSNNHFIILYGNKSSNNEKYDIKLSMRPFKIISTVLKTDMKIPYDKITKIFRNSGNNTLSILREIKNCSFITQPSWSKDKTLINLIPLLFLGQIDQNNKKDIELLEKISNEEKTNYLKKIYSWKKIDDSPIIFHNETIKINAIGELWNELYEQIMPYHFDNLKSTIKYIFNKDLKKIKTNSIALFPEINDYYSEYIYINLLNSLILYSIKNETKQFEINQLVKEILNSIKNLNQLKYISTYLPLLTECAPEFFLNFFEDMLNNQKKIITDFFSSNGTFYPMKNEYTRLLVSLIILTHFKKYKIRACDLLIKLYLLNIKYDIKNSPEDSLITCLTLWSNDNAFSLDEKVKFLLKKIEENKNNVFELCLKIITNDMVSLTNLYLQWRNPEIGKKSKENYIQGSEKIIKKILEYLSPSEIEIYFKILNIYKIFTNTTIEELKTYTKEKFQTDEQKKPIYDYLFNKIKEMKIFEKNKLWINLFEELLNLVIPKDNFMKNIVYFNNFKSYESVSEEKLIELKKLYNEMKNNYSSNFLIENFSSSLNNQHTSAYILSEILLIEEIEETLHCLLKNKKIYTLVFLLNFVHKKFNITTFLNSISQKNLEKIIQYFGQYNITNFDKDILSNDKLKNIYWSNKHIYNDSSEKEINQIKKHNPLRYLEYLSTIDFKLWNINEIITTLKKITLNQIKNENRQLYFLQKILYKLNDISYEEDIAFISMKFYGLSWYKKMLKSIRRYFFENPIELIKILLNKTDNQLFIHIYMDYYLPDDFEKNIKILKKFCDTFYHYETNNKKDKEILLYKLGTIFAKSIKYSSDPFIPNCLKNIIEEYKNPIIRNGFTIGHYNNIGWRNRDDGTKDLNLSKQYEEKAYEIQDDFPETSKILEEIAINYKNNSKRMNEDFIVNQIF